MQEEELLNRGGHVRETIGWLSFDGRPSSDGDILIDGGTVTNAVSHLPGSVSFGQTFTSAPSLIAKIGSFNGADSANLRIQSVTTNGFASFVQVEQSFDLETLHVRESVSFLALEGSSGVISGFAA